MILTVTDAVGFLFLYKRIPWELQCEPDSANFIQPVDGPGQFPLKRAAVIEESCCSNSVAPSVFESKISKSYPAALGEDLQRPFSDIVRKSCPKEPIRHRKRRIFYRKFSFLDFGQNLRRVFIGKVREQGPEISLMGKMNQSHDRHQWHCGHTTRQFPS